jgi:hypothetical protein
VNTQTVHPACVCGHPAHSQFPKGGCHCGCSIFEPDVAPQRRSRPDAVILFERQTRLRKLLR